MPHYSLHLPIESPVLNFLIFLSIILFSSIFLQKIKIPPLIGLLLAGMAIGPKGLHLLERNASVVLFGTVGLLYILFLAGLEIDLHELKRNKNKSIVFGVFTFLIPMLLGTTVFYYFLNYSWTTSILVASMFASHTLLTYPILSKLGITKDISVNLTVGGTMITDTAALLVLAVIASSTQGELTPDFWVRLIVSIIIFSVIVLLVFPIVGRWFFKLSHDSVMHFIFILFLLFLAAALAELAGIEAIIGAFFAGIALNRLIPHHSPLMNRLEFVGNAIFIPFFLIGVGMLIDLKAFFQGWQALLIATLMTVIAIVAKFLAAYFTQKNFRLTTPQRNIIFGLSNSQAAATLAAVLVGYNIILGYDTDNQPIRLLDDYILNGTIVMILITCTLSSFVTQNAAVKIAREQLKRSPLINSSLLQENSLIGLSNEATLPSLLDFAFITLNKKQKPEITALHVIPNTAENTEKEGKAHRLIENAQQLAAAADVEFRTFLRYDQTPITGIINTVKERQIRHLYIGLHEKTSLLDSFFGNLIGELLQKSNCIIYIQQTQQPLNTIQNYALLISENAEVEPGFFDWFNRILRLGEHTNNPFKVFAHPNTIQFLKLKYKKVPFLTYLPLESYDDFFTNPQNIPSNTMLIVNLARSGSVSYHLAMDRVPTYLQKKFRNINFVLVYPNIYPTNVL